MIRRILPLSEIHPPQHPTLTTDPGIDLVIWQDHGVHLHWLDVVGVVAQDAGQFDLPDFPQLFQGEAAWPTAVLVPEPVAVFDVAELFADDAGKSRTDLGEKKVIKGFLEFVN